ncbi:MAG: class A beta-lactamase [Phenylobacterium sp.]|uniref:class A beta-lactamase n=1 Tax=Phenylobacterium sp. TaxID=1871053 RepID=UPI001B63FF99|nr:class A beta-lactamase [Phenylobacterium sp.]MBP7815089.1 class A beta-lactamase [Phenylobacterium sp.]MBP9231427.1 class A beta-lactamase [Phenylobacterium sp.]MBP9753777.1 class A beta-lactamase [Phenylobacterium sp.]
MTRGSRASRRRVAHGQRWWFGLVALLLASVLSLAPSPAERPPEGRSIQQAVAARAAPGLSARIKALGRGFNGRVGIAVRDVDEGWTVAFDGDSKYPQQSVSKLWVALAALDAVDKGQMALGDTLVVRKDDLSIFHQPLRKYVGDNGYPVTVVELIRGAIAQSDNAANDVLVGHVGGQAAVQAILDHHRLKGVWASPPEKEMQTRIAGLDWKPAYSFEHTFWEERDTLSPEARSVNLDAYLQDPYDAATPVGIATGLARLKRGELLSPASTDLLLRIMGQTETGPGRLPAGLAPGWTLAHKTGTGQVWGAVATGFNDVGILTAPDGHSYAVAVMIAQTRRPVSERQDLMAAVARAVVAHHEGRSVR